MLAAAITLGGCTKKEAAPPPPVEVVVTEAVQKDVPIVMEMVGRRRDPGRRDQARVEGYLDRFFFTEGAFVKKGARLYQIDPKPFASRGGPGEGQSGHRPSAARSSVDHRQPFDALEAQKRGEPARARQRLANQDAARPRSTPRGRALDKAQLDLGYTSITSPIDGSSERRW
jgi:membrane fusion protein (multidrug efflux system)